MSIMLSIILVLFSWLNVFANDCLNKFPTDIRYYTVQIKSFPYEKQNQAYGLFESLREKNYPVYHVRREVDNKYYIAIRVGIFREVSQAKLYAKQFREKEGFEYLKNNLWGLDVLKKDAKEGYTIVVKDDDKIIGTGTIVGDYI